MARYLTKRKTKSGYHWTLTPPEDLLEAGVARKLTFRDGRAAHGASKVLEKKVEQFRKGELVGKELPKEPSIRQLMGHYLQTKRLASLSTNTQNVYTRTLEAICRTPYKSKTLGDLKVSSLTSKICGEIYEHWVSTTTIPVANERKRIFGVLMAYGLSLDLLERNPMASVRPLKHTPETTTWTRQQVQSFLDTAFTDFRWRSIGLLVLLCYEWGQRPVDIANLKWDNLDFETDTVRIKQRKRGATVELPIEPEIKEILLKQREDYDFQQYVLPVLGGDKAWKPMQSTQWTNLSKEVKQAAGLPQGLNVGTLRKTAIMEMVEGGADAVQIKQVSGHKSISSLNPYIKNTRKGAEKAQSYRKKS